MTLRKWGKRIVKILPYVYSGVRLYFAFREKQAD